MRQKTHHPVSARQRRDGLYYPRGWITIALLLFSLTAFAQEQTPPNDFILDAVISYDGLLIEPIYNSFIDCGFNTMTQQATEETKSLLENLNLHAWNMKDSTDWIYYYSSSYYSKWEAEEDQPHWDRVGVKHSAGEAAYWNDGNDSVLCWSTKGLTGPVDTLVYGPTYHQVKFYRRWLYDNYDIFNRLKYTPRFRMALSNPHSIPDTSVVCRLYVLMKYRRIVEGIPDSTDSTYVLKEPITLRVSDFPANGEFDYFYMSNIPSQRSYKYPSWLWDPITDKLTMPYVENIYRDDKWGGTGVQFCIDWLRTDTLSTLYIDYIEVYDNDGWNYYLNNPVLRANDIKDYALYYKNSGWNNIKYWLGGHEPASLDAYTPVKTVDSILKSINAPPLMNTVWAYWNQDLNGEPHLEQYYNIVKPSKLLVEFHPILSDYDVAPPIAFEVLRRILQESSILTQEKKFYYHVQSYGQWKDGNWYVLRFPSVPEYKTTIMLALAHGADGLVQASYDSQPQGPIYHGIYGLIGIAPDYDTTDIWYELRDNIIPRIKGNLGKTLMALNYTGDYLYLGRYLQQLCCGFENSEPSVTERYLTLSAFAGESTPPPVHFHSGFFSKPGQSSDNYFMLNNLITTNEKTVILTIEPPISGYENYRFRNIEGIFDTTFKDDGITKLITYPPGEGYLYQVAPVIKYGGRLLYSEATTNGMILYDDMVIESGAVLTVNGVYSSKGNITVKSGGIINGSNGKIQFAEGKKLIIEGSGSITGASNSKLHLVFTPSQNDDPTGIEIKSGGSLSISNCKIENANVGINSLLNANYLSAQKVDFINCGDYAISILGQSSGMNSPPPPQISNCLIQNSGYGISVANLPGLLIQGNTITNTHCGIYLSNVTDAQVIGNTIISNREELEGIILLSSGGVTRGNTVSGHTVGIHLANSSPILGSNRLTNNKIHGMYVGAGSLPYMRQGQWAGIPPNMYATSGYNKIYNNGGYEGPGNDNDGSEIYFYNSNALMDRGCNSIYDNRQPSPPLINTLLLMNGYSSGFPIIIQAQNNFWGDTVYAARFGNLNVQYIPYELQPCPEPQGSEDELVRMTSFGDVIDTVYAINISTPQLTETELLYAEAEGYFLTGDLTNALQVYEGIINSTATEEEKYFAYQRKYSIGRLTSQSTEYFNQLSNVFATLASNTQDTLNKKILGQFSTLSKVGEQEYETAIGEFDNIIYQNPNSEEAVYAEIDALTTALLIEENDSTLQKGRLGKYLVKSSANYHQRVDEILRKNFGSGSKENQRELTPTEYTLYQNYPNPFNPTTTIKYDLPNVSEVSLIIYDILGRKVKELVNTKQQAGRYEVQFSAKGGSASGGNASNLASGVYIYQLIAEKYMSSKKMILLR